MIEDDFPAYSQRFKSWNFRVPSSLVVTNAEIRRVLVVGSCLAQRLSESMPFPCDFILFNGGVLDDLPRDAAYDFQIVQIPLRAVIGDDTFWHVAYESEEEYRRIFAECCERLAHHFHQYARFHRERGFLTFVANFMVPAQNANGRLLRQYDLRNIQYFVQKLNEELEMLCLGARDLHLLDIDNIANTFGKRFITDEAMFWYPHAAQIPLTQEEDVAARLEPTPPIFEHFELAEPLIFHNAVITECLAMLRTLRQMDPVKLIVSDLDDTLWKGVSGEMDKIEPVMSWLWSAPIVPMTEGWPLGIAEALLYCKKRGILLAIISKNDDQRVRAIFSDAFDGKMSLEDFAITRINWRSKAENMAEILADLNVLPEHVLYIDDSPVERAAMAQAYPAMRIIGRYFRYTRPILLWSPETQVATVTGESARRSEMVQGQVKREERRRELTEAEFLADLGLSVELFEIDDMTHPRIARTLELINKTNQWNLSGERFDFPSLAAILQRGWRIFGFSARDRFTNYGDIGSLILDGTVVRHGVMSCRVIGMGVEARVLREIGDRIGAGELSFCFRETGRNAAIRQYLDANAVKRDGQYVLELG